MLVAEGRNEKRERKVLLAAEMRGVVFSSILNPKLSTPQP
jgi:hypothetical protein